MKKLLPTMLAGAAALAALAVPALAADPIGGQWVTQDKDAVVTIGDCGGSETYVWDGKRFRLTEATSMGECRGAWHWIRTWSARVSD